VIREDRRVLRRHVTEDVFEMAGDARVERLPFLAQNACVGRLLGQRMLEGVLPLGTARPLADQLRPQEVGQRTIQVARRAANRRHGPVLEQAADNRGVLEDRLGGPRQPVNARREDPAEGGGDGPLFRVLTNDPPLALAAEDALLDERPNDLFQKERVAFGAREDRLPNRVGQIRDAQQVLGEAPAIGLGQCGQPELGQPVAVVDVREEDGDELPLIARHSARIVA
jgi:hypothetical protein